MTIAVTRAVSPAIDRCELGFQPRQPIDLERAREQHREYEACLAELGLTVVSLPAEPDLPDSVFVEDPAIVVDEVAVMTRMGAPSRRGESDSLAAALARFRPLRWLGQGTDGPATLEGGDVLRIGRTVFAGLSRRTTLAGIAQLRAGLQPLGYTVTPVEVRGCLHLKSACSYAGDGVILANRAWADAAPLAGFRIVDVAPSEPGAANVLAIGDTVVVARCYPETAAILSGLGRRVRTLDISELMKAEAALTCSSLIFEA